MKYLAVISLLLAASTASAQLETIRTLTPEQGQEVRRPIEAKIFRSSLESLPALEAELLDIFQASETTLEGKQYACRMLRHCASDASVSVLAPELGNPELSQFVRRVFQSLETPAANAALIAALPTVETELQAGLIGTLGQMRSSKSVAAIAPYLQSERSEVQFATLTALGNIGGEDACKVLIRSWITTESNPRFKHERMLASLKAENDSLHVSDSSLLKAEDVQVRVAALIAYARRSPSEAAPVIFRKLNTGNPRERNAAMGLLRIMKVDDLLVAIPTLSPQNQVLIISELANRKAMKAESEILELTKNNDAAIQDAAFQALENLGGTKSIQPLLTAAMDNPVAYNALCGLNAPGCDAALIQTLETSADEQVQGKMIECLTARQATAALPAFVEIAGGDWSRNCKMVIDGLASLVQEESFQSYAELMLSSDSQKKTAALEQSIITAAQRLSDKDACARPMIFAYGKADADTKCAIVRTLGGIGGKSARLFLAHALVGTDPEIQDAAIRGLAGWPTLDTADQLLEIATTADTEKLQVLALRAYIRLAYTMKDSAENLAMCKKAAAATNRPAELKNIIGCVKQNKNEEVLAFLTKQLDNPEVITEAGWAICEISGQRKLKVSDRPVLEKLAQSPDAQLATEAQRILNQ